MISLNWAISWLAALLVVPAARDYIVSASIARGSHEAADHLGRNDSFLLLRYTNAGIGGRGAEEEVGDERESECDE